MEPIKVATLFAGCGGDSLGFRNAGMEITYANDINPNACATLEAVFGKDVIHWGNVRKENSFGNPNVITGGFPCQGFSLAGPRLIEDRRNTLYLELKRAISIVNPEFFVAENVKGFVTLGENGNDKFFENGHIRKLGKMSSAIVESFASVGKGYDVNIDLHNAKEFGLPQDRERVIIVGVRKDLDYKFFFPKPTHGPGLKDYVTLRDAIGAMPEPLDGEVHDGYYSSRYMSRNRIRGWDEVSFTIPAEAGQVTLHPESKPMVPVTQGLFWDIEQRMKKNKDPQTWDDWKEKFHPFIKNEESSTGNLFWYSVKDKRTFTGGRPRRLSWKECARIQGFPDGYPFKGSLEEIYRQIGNAVPPPLMQKIAENILPYFRGKRSSDMRKSAKKIEVYA